MFGSAMRVTMRATNAALLVITETGIEDYTVLLSKQENAFDSHFYY